MENDLSFQLDYVRYLSYSAHFMIQTFYYLFTEVEILGGHQQLNGHEFEQTPGESERQKSLLCYSPWCHRVGHNLMTEQQQED